VRSWIRSGRPDVPGGWRPAGIRLPAEKTGERPGLDNPALHHDLRNHLTVILGFAELLLVQTLEADARRRDLEAIRDAAAAALDELNAAERRRILR